MLHTATSSTTIRIKVTYFALASRTLFSSHHDNGHHNTYNELESFDREGPSEPPDLPNITQQSREDKTLEMHIIHQQKASQITISGQRKSRKYNDFLVCVGKKRATNSQKI